MAGSIRCLAAGLAAWAALCLISGCRSAGEPSAPAPAPASRPALSFREIAAESGIRYAWGPRGRSPLTNLDTFGAGCGFADLDRDGFLDVIAVGEPGIRLFRGAAGGQFVDVSEQAGLTHLKGHWIGAACGDVDGDGWPDLLVTGFRRLALLRSQEGRRFVDATAAAGLSAANWGRWGSSAGFADLDGDGDLDLVLMNYVPLRPDSKRFCELAPGVISGCPPGEYDPDYTRLYRSDGGRFRDVTVASGANTTHGKGLALAFCDYDADGRVDIFLGNDGTPSDLLRNLGGFRFRNVGIETGAAFGTTGQPTAAMGAAWADVDRDGDYDLAVSAFSDEEYTLLEQARGLFVPISGRAGLGLPTFKPLGFGTLFLDADNDGWQDLHFANGHVYDNVALIDPGSTYRQPMMLFHRGADGRYTDLAPRAGAGFAEPLVGRGSAAGDFDNDGRVDLLVVDLEGTLQLFRNETANENHWLTLDLRGAQPGNRLAYGARVEARAGGSRLLGQVSPASSYLSTSDPRVHFGLGAADRVDLVRITWPSGRVQEARGLAADRTWRWTEGAAPRAAAVTPDGPEGAGRPEHPSAPSGPRPAR